LHEREQSVAQALSFSAAIPCNLSGLRTIEKREGQHVHLFKINSAVAMRTFATLHLLACSACAAGTAIAGPWDPNEVDLVPMKISDGLYALVSSTADKNNPTGIPEATTGGIVIGEKGVLVVESMLNERLANQVLQRVKELAGDKPIRYLVNTVYHGDHYYGNYLFPTSTTIIMHMESKKYIDSKFEADRRFMINLMGNDKGLGDVKPRAGDMMIDHDTSIDLGGRVVELKVFGQGQTKGDLFVWLPQEKALFTSNTVLAEQPALPWLLEGNHDLSLQTLRAIKAFLPPDAIIIPGHGRPTTIAKSLDYLIGYLETLDREVHVAVENGLTLEETVKAVAMEEYGGYKLYPWTHKQMNVPHAYKRIKGLE
jgi:cyclase